MKKALRASILLNLALAICLLALLRQRNSGSPPVAAELAPAETPAPPENASDQANSSASRDADTVGEQAALSQFSSTTEIPFRKRSQERPVSMPLVFQDVDVSQLKLNREQIKGIDDLRQRFLDEIGGLEQNPNDPAYYERWLKSQPQIDDDLRGMIGMSAFQNYQIQAIDLEENTGNVR
jgi:hypothetical protein